MVQNFGRAGTTVKTFLEDIRPNLTRFYYDEAYYPGSAPYIVDKFLTSKQVDAMRLLDKKVAKLLQKAEAPEKAVIKEKEKANAVVRKLEKFITEAPGRTNIGDETGKQYIGVGGTKPPLANEKWEETALKMNIMDAIDRNLDYVAWTPSEVQIAQWGEDSAELYRNIYDKRLPKNAKKFIKEFGGELQKGKVDYGSHKGLGEREVWIIKITPEMKKNLTKQGGMPLYSFAPAGTAPMFQPPIGLLSTSQTSENDGRIDENKGLLQ